jgi:dCTP deaminase
LAKKTRALYANPALFGALKGAALDFQRPVVDLPKSAQIMPAILSDQEIASYCEAGMVDPYSPELVGPASLDVRLGEEIMVETPDSPDFCRVSIANKTADNPYLIAPGAFILAHTKEKFFLPPDLCATFALKSSRGREGLSHALSAFCDPGWSNSRLTLELHSLLKYNYITLWPGKLIGQMIFSRMSKAPAKTYAETGHYNNCSTVMPSFEHILNIAQR